MKSTGVYPVLKWVAMTWHEWKGTGSIAPVMAIRVTIPIYLNVNIDHGRFDFLSFTRSKAVIAEYMELCYG